MASFRPFPGLNAGTFAVMIRSADHSKADLSSHHHIIGAAGAVDDEDISAAVEATDDPHMTVARVKDEVARLGIAPADGCAVAVLGRGAAAMADDIAAARLVVEYPIDESRTI